MHGVEADRQRPGGVQPAKKTHHKAPTKQIENHR